MRRRGEAGSSLIEVLVASTIMAILVVALAAGYLSASRVSNRTSDSTVAASALTRATEAALDLPYQRCATLAAMRSSVGSLPVPAGFTLRVDSVKYLTSGGTSFASGTCTTDRGAQLVTISLVPSGIGVPEVRGDVVLRDPRARP